MMTVQPTRYIFPPRAQDAIPFADTAIFGSLGWVAQYKLNDSRCLIKFLPSPTGNASDVPVELWNRHAERFRDYFAPDWLLEQLRTVHQLLRLDPNEWSLLDGGLLDKKHKEIKDTIAVWDILVRDGSHLVDSTYGERHAQISPLERGKPYHIGSCHVGYTYTDNVFLSMSYQPHEQGRDTWAEMWTKIEQTNEPYWYKATRGTVVEDKLRPLIEGLVFKDPCGKLESGRREKNNQDWMIRSRVQTGRHLF